MKRLLDSSEIIKIATQIQSPGMSYEDAHRLIAAEIQQPATKFFRQGNTLFIIHPTENPRIGFFRALNADDARSYMDNCEEFTKAAYALGFDILFTQFQDPSLINIFRYVGRNRPADMGYKVEQTEDGMYQVTVQIGPKRG